MARVDDPKQAAQEAGLTYVSDEDPGLARERHGEPIASPAASA
jgi:DNA topoisomerase IB